MKPSNGWNRTSSPTHAAAKAASARPAAESVIRGLFVHVIDHEKLHVFLFRFELYAKLRRDRVEQDRQDIVRRGTVVSARLQEAGDIDANLVFALESRLIDHRA